MSTTYTTNYHLGKQTDTSDTFDMSVITDNMDIIDTVMVNLQTEIVSVKSANEKVQQSIYAESYTNVKDELKVTSYPYGIRTGFWNDNGSASTSSSWIMTAAKIRSFDVEGYSQFFSGAIFGAISFPSAVLSCSVKAWNSSDELVQKITVLSGETFEVIPNCTYGISFKVESEASSYITEEFATQIIIRKYTEMIADIKSEIETVDEKVDELRFDGLIQHQFDWMMMNQTSGIFHAWSTGYYRGSTGEKITSSNYLSTKKFRKTVNGFFEGVSKINIAVPSERGVAILEWDETGEFVGMYGNFVTTSDYTSEVEIELKEGYYYAFDIGRWADGDASDSLTEEFLETVVLTLYSTSNKLPNFDTFIRFDVTTNLAWPNVASTEGDNEDITIEQEVKCIMRLPAEYSVTGKPVPIILFGHGNGGYISNTEWYGNNTTSVEAGNILKLINAFVTAGYAVFDVSNTRNNSSGWSDWGCMPLMTAYLKAWDYIKNNFNVETSRIFLLSDSMGTAANLNFMKWYHGVVAASIMLAPRPFCSYRYERNTEEAKREMEASFGITTEGEWDYERLKGFDNYENMVNIGDTDMIPVNFPPCKVIVGKDDTQFIDDVRAYYAALNNYGNYVSYREIDNANHGDISTLREPFSGLKIECVNWFNRFRNVTS